MHGGLAGADDKQPTTGEEPSGEVQTLRRCTRDIVAISALPAVWASQAPAQVAGSLAMQLIVDDLEEFLLCLLIAITPVP